MSKICPSCGAKLDNDSDFCTECGNRLNVPARTAKNGVKIGNFIGENDNIQVLDEKGPSGLSNFKRI
jgi:predicted amidophosphoribosyltransferase